MAVSEVDVGKLVVRLLLNDEQYNAAVKNAEGTTKALSTTIGPLVDLIGDALTTAFRGAALAATGLAAASTAVGASFEKQMAQLAAVAGGLSKTDEAYQRLKARAEEMGATTQFSATQAAEGMTALAQAGLSTDQVIQAIQPALDLAVASQIGLGEATEIVASTMKQFGLQASDAAHITDVLAQGTQASLLSMQDLAVSMRYAGSASAGVGISLEETVAVLAQFRDLGLDAEQVGTNYRAMISSLSDPTKEATATLERLGLSAAQVSPEINSLKDVLKALGESSMTTADAFSIFGVQAGANVAAIANGLASSSANFDQLLSDLQTKTGALAGMVAVQTDTVSSAWDEVTSAAESAGIALFDGFSEPLRDLLEETKTVIMQIADEFDLQSGRIRDQFAENLTGPVEGLGTTLGQALIEITLAMLDVAGAVRAIGEAVAPVLPYLDDMLVGLTAIAAAGKALVWLEGLSTLLGAAGAGALALNAPMVLLAASLGAVGVAAAVTVDAIRSVGDAEAEMVEATRAVRARLEAQTAATRAEEEAHAAALQASTVAARDAAAAEGTLSSEFDVATRAVAALNAEVVATKLRLGELIDVGGQLRGIKEILGDLDEEGIAAMEQRRTRMAALIRQQEDQVARLQSASAFASPSTFTGGVATNRDELIALIDARKAALVSAKSELEQFNRTVATATQELLDAEQKKYEDAEARKNAARQAAAREANAQAESEYKSHLDQLNRLLSEAETYGLTEVERLQREKKAVLEDLAQWRIATAEQVAEVEIFYEKMIAAEKKKDEEKEQKNKEDEEKKAQASREKWAGVARDARVSLLSDMGQLEARFNEQVEELYADRYLTEAEKLATLGALNAKFVHEQSEILKKEEAERAEILKRSQSRVKELYDRFFQTRIGSLREERDETISVLKAEGVATKEFITQISAAYDREIGAERMQGIVAGVQRVAGTVRDVVSAVAQVYSTTINVVRTAMDGFFNLLEGLTGFRVGLFDVARQAQAMVANGEARTTGEAASSIVASAAAQALAFVQALVESAPEIMRGLGEALPELLQAVAAAAPEVAQAIGAAIPGIIQIVAENLGPIIQSFVDAADLILSALAEGIGTLVNALVDAFKENAARSIELMNAFIVALISGIGDLVVGIIEALPTILDALLGGLPRIIDALINAVGDVVAAFIRAIPDIVTSIIEALPDIIFSLIEGLVDMVPQLIDAIISMVPRLIQAIIASLPQLFTDIIPRLIPIIGQILIQALVDSVANIVKILGDIFEAIFAPKKYAERMELEQRRAAFDAERAAAAQAPVNPATSIMESRQAEIDALASAAASGDMAALAQLYSMLSGAEARNDATQVRLLQEAIASVGATGSLGAPAGVSAMSTVRVSTGAVTQSPEGSGWVRNTAAPNSPGAAGSPAAANAAADPIAVMVKIGERDLGQALVDAQNQGRLGGLQGRLGLAGNGQAVGMANLRPVIR